MCKCGKPATHRAKVPIRHGHRTTIGGPYYWCADCVKLEKERTPGTVAVPLEVAV